MYSPASHCIIKSSSSTVFQQSPSLFIRKLTPHHLMPVLTDEYEIVNQSKAAAIKANKLQASPGNVDVDMQHWRRGQKLLILHVLSQYLNLNVGMYHAQLTCALISCVIRQAMTRQDEGAC